MDLNKYLKEHRKPVADSRIFENAPFIKCRDGFELSVQASKYHYCGPRSDNGPWYEVEVGFPSAEPELIMSYAEDSERPTETVYGYVPIELVEELIELHGGMVVEDNSQS